MSLLSRREFYQMLGHALRNAREKLALSRAQAAEELNQIRPDPEQVLRSIAARMVVATQIRRQKKLTREQVAKRGNLPVEFVRDFEEGKILNPDVYSVYCLSYGLRISLAKFQARVERLSRTPLDKDDRPIE
jgi:ribosome-binding protein aMBF1 (putative translation factor)